MNPKCVQCNKEESILWRKNSENEEICNECFEESKIEKKPSEEIEESSPQPMELEKEESSKESNSKEEKAPEVPKSLRKSTRATRFKNSKSSKQKNHGKTSRRSNVFKQAKPMKTPLDICAETKTKNYVFYEGFYYQIGDIISVQCRGKTYYAQIKALIVDTFTEKSAVLTWLIPTTASPDPEKSFDPATYLIGLEEDIPRKLSAMTWIMNAPSNYFFSRTEPFSKPEELSDSLYEKGKKPFIWTSVH